MALNIDRPSINLRVYYYWILAGFGGLTGWYLIATLFGGTDSVQSMGYEAARGSVLGAMIGFGVGSFEGIANRSLVRFIKFGGVSLLLGLGAGLIALPLTQMLYGYLTQTGPAEVKPRGISFLVGTICWIVFGGLVGIGEGFSKGSQTWKGMLGGMLGGALGGGLYEALGRNSVHDASSSADQVFLAVALCMLGGFIGCSVALVATLLKDAWLIVENGKLAGTEINISKYVDRHLGSRRSGMIGSSQWDANIYLPGDIGVLPRHAEISYIDGAPTISALPEAKRRNAIMLVNGRNVSSWPLGNGDRLQIGSTSLIYRQKRR